MEYINFKNIQIPVVGQGIGNYKWDNSHASNIKAGIDLGMTLLDTAESYCSGVSEELIGYILKTTENKNILISTKFAPENNIPEKIIKSFIESCKRLGGVYPTIYQMHWYNPEFPIIDILKVLLYLKQEKFVKLIGYDNIDIDTLKYLALNYPVDIIQAEYNLFDRTQEKDVIPYCQNNNILFMAYSPLDQGRVIGNKEILDCLFKIANKYNKTIQQISLKWLVSHHNVIVIPKAMKKSHIIDNGNIFDFNLTSEEFNEIEYVTRREIIYIKPSKINVVQDGQNNRFAYSTLKEALENKRSFVPSPESLSTTINNSIKPVRVWFNGNNYELLEGRIRYWAWVIAKKDEPIPCLLRDSKF